MRSVRLVRRSRPRRSRSKRGRTNLLLLFALGLPQRRLVLRRLWDDLLFLVNRHVGCAASFLLRCLRPAGSSEAEVT